LTLLYFILLSLSGLGLEMSKALAEAGADVAMMYVSNDSTHDTAAAIGKQFNKNVRAYKCELTNVDQVREVIDKIHADYGRIDVFVANAGVSEGGAAEVTLWKFITENLQATVGVKH
jgi:sorbose reductase